MRLGLLLSLLLMLLLLLVLALLVPLHFILGFKELLHRAKMGLGAQQESVVSCGDAH
jgi:hypothetical protein